MFAHGFFAKRHAIITTLLYDHVHKAHLLLSIRSGQICESVCRLSIVLGYGTLHKNSVREYIKKKKLLTVRTPNGKQLTIAQSVFGPPRSVVDFVAPV